jgi:DnaJ like chaperone protein
MTIWAKIAQVLQAVGASSAGLLDRLVAAVLGTSEQRRGVAFTVAVVALSAKMARVDGKVTNDEVAAFRRYFSVAPGDEPSVRRLFALAQADIAGFEAYARRIGALFADEPTVREDVLEGLFLIAAADGWLHESELAFLERVAELFQVSPAAFRRIKAHFVDDPDDPYAVLGVAPDADPPTLKARHRTLVRALHPDMLIARGVPPEFVRIANDRLAAVNAAWARIAAERGM